MGGDPEMMAVGLLDDGRRLGRRDVVFERDLDQVGMVEKVGADRAPGVVGTVDGQEFLVEDRLGKRRVEALQIVAAHDQLATRCQDSRPGHPSRIDRVAKRGVAVDARMAEVAHRREAALQILARQLRTEQHPLARRHGDRQQQAGREVAIVAAHTLGFGRHHHVEQQMAVAVDEAREEGRAAEVDPSRAGRGVGFDQRRRAHLPDSSILDEHGGGREHRPGPGIEQPVRDDQRAVRGLCADAISQEETGKQHRTESKQDKPEPERDRLAATAPAAVVTR